MRRGTWGRAAADSLPWVALLALGAWAAWPGPGKLVLAAVLGVGALLMEGRRRTLRSLGLMVILATVVVGFVHLDARRKVRSDWRTVWAQEEERIVRELQEALQPILDGGPRVASTLADMAADGNVPTHREVSRLRRREGFHVAAVFDPSGALVVWDGDHRGRVPAEVARGEAEFLYRDLPLAAYLYVTWPVQGGGTAMVATLVRTDLPDQVRRATGDFVSRFQDRTGADIRIQPASRVGGDDGVFDLTWGETPLFSVTVEPVTEAQRLLALERLARLWGMTGVTLAWLILALAPGVPQPRRAAASALALALFLPWEAVAPESGLADPAAFLLLDLPLARWVVVTGVLAVVSGLVLPRPRIPAWLGALVTAGIFPVAAWGWRRSVSADYLAGPDESWLPVVLSLSLGLTVVSGLLVAWAREGDRPATHFRVLLGWGLALGLPLGTAVAAGLTPGVHPAVLAAWGLPLLVWGEAGMRALRSRTAMAWLAAGLLGSGAAIPYLWGGRIESRMALAEAQVDRLGVQEDPFLEFLLARLSHSVDSLAAEGVRPVELLYGAWKSSGLAEASYPIWLTLWTEGGFPREHLPIGMASASLPQVAYTLNDPEPGSAMRILRYEAADAHYAVQIPLPDGWVVTGVVPPVEEVGKELLLGPLFGSLEQERGPPLRMIPLLPGDRMAQDTLTWNRSGTRWRGELALTYPEERFHAHFEVDLAGPAVALARATLLLGMVLALAGLLRAAGRGIRGLPGPLVREALGRLRSFRARVTLALFGFFAVSNLIFAMLAYRTITGASDRAAQVLAERVVSDAAGSYLEEAGEIELLAQRVGSDLLEYRDAGLREGSLEPLVELGLYEGWVPYPVFRSLTEREVVIQAAPTVVGEWSYVTAYRRLPDGDILGAPVPLETGATAVRSREVIHLLGFAMLAGMGLSIFLAVLVGRALARPIQALRVASERVGSGNLGMRLPTDRTDEFGTVFHAFNRMVRRLRKARRTLVRNTRRTRAIVEDAATGVVALDPQGTVTLVNARARTLLEADIREGSPLGTAGGAAGEVVAWVKRMTRDGLEEAGTEVQLGDRRLRVQARRITQDIPQASGVVLSVEDVTDELRSERILAWGEMARQVAHEVKNPLTPIKLSVQHIRRAWDDQRPDFGDILNRNAEAMLGEIDRLAAIASGFSRFGAPGSSGAPLEPVDLAAVVEETMTLYGAGEGPVRFRVDAVPGLPPVRSRRGEVKEVLVNLLENSRAAIEGEGEVCVEVAPCEGGVALRVRDNGTGIQEDLLPRIFEPHFSTRSAGTGLGLAIVKRIVESWGASVSVTSEAGRGTVAAVVFPSPGG
ncbi:MAG TPA: ATP-binding protein [Longimicrobiales bacterium]|nr:ATP-binding protein [Longimicrobiales bacterium]